MTSKQKTPATSPPIYVVGGGKGGVGKSMFTMALLDALAARETSVLLVETDTSNPDVYKSYEDAVDQKLLIDLDDVDGWIVLINEAQQHPDHLIVVNSAARNQEGVQRFGETLLRSLPELNRELVTFWLINRQRDSVELLADYVTRMEGTRCHVVRNKYFGEPHKFDFFNASKLRGQLESEGGTTLDFPDLADRVTDDLFTGRMTIAAGMQEFPLGHRAELGRWQREASAMFQPVFAHETTQRVAVSE